MKNLLSFRFLALLSVFILFFGCTGSLNDSTKGVAMDKKTAKQGDEVSVWYIGSFENGTLFDTNLRDQAVKAGLPERPNYDSLIFKIGEGSVIKGFEDAAVGMKENETKSVKIPPEEAYGAVRKDLVVLVDKSTVQDGDKLILNSEVQASNGMYGRVTNVSGTNLTLDFNHPLAGKTLVFTITVTKITSG
ncbi:MAG: peptidylprolyl isomerase [Candidatus Micrarchaeota archaeon]